MRCLVLVPLLFVFLSCKAAEPLPELGSVPEWALRSSEGKAVGSEDLSGHVLIYDFIFTRCAATCPMMTSRMGELASHLRSEDVRFVSISVDPEWDRPAVLREYRDRVTKDRRWIFLTGSREEIRELSVDGFFLAAEPPEENLESGPIVHSTKFVLVDRQGIIRGYYDSLSPEMMESLAADARQLLKS